MTLTRLNPKARLALQILGPLVVIGGIVLIIIGTMSMSDLSPNGGIGKFGLAFLGVPLLFVGAVLSKIGYLKPAAEIFVTETADAAAFGTQNIAKAAAEGFGGRGHSAIKVRCRGCGELDDEHAKFCSGCGQPM